MGKRPRRNHSPAFKTKVALAAVKGGKTLAELARQNDVHLNLINQWRARLLEGAADVFGSEPAPAPAPAEPTVDVMVLHARIGELTLANDFFCRRAREGRSVAERKTMIERGHALPLGAASPTICRGPYLRLI